MHENVLEATAATFSAKVIERSRERAVLVDFWAAWCGPCQALAPLLEELAARRADGLDVVKVDSDAEADLAARYGVRGLPTLLVFRHGQVVDSAVGMQSPAALDALVSPYLPRPSDAAVERGAAQLARGEWDAARATLEAAQALAPEDYRIHPLLAECLIELGALDEAANVLHDLPAAVAVDDEVTRVRARLDLVRSGKEAADTAPADDPVAATYARALEQAGAGDYDAAVEALLGLLPAQRDWRDGAVRRALLEIFQVLEGDSRLKDWRARMARHLH